MVLVTVCNECELGFGIRGVMAMSILTVGDVVKTMDNGIDLHNKIVRLLLMYHKTQYVFVPKFSFLTIEKVEKDCIIVKGWQIKETKHTVSEPIIDAGAGPAGFAPGWRASSEDIVGYKEIYDHSTYGIVFFTASIPMIDLVFADDKEFKEIEASYIDRVKKKKESDEHKITLAAIERKRKELEVLEAAKKKYEIKVGISTVFQDVIGNVVV